MNRYKIHRTDHYIIIESEDGKHTWTGLAKDVKVMQNTDSPIHYKIINVRGWGYDVDININQILKQDGNPYNKQAWESWYFKNTGRNR